MPLSTDTLTVLREWIGDEPDDATLDMLYDLLGNYDEVVMYVLRNRLANLTTSPGSVTVPGVSISHGTDYQALISLIAKFQNEGGTGLEEAFVYGFALTSVRKNYPR